MAEMAACGGMNCSSVVVDAVGVHTEPTASV